MSELIYCVMANSPIAHEHCLSEQHPKGCAGCKAPTRRCTSCHQPLPIVNSEQGFCAECHAKKGKPQLISGIGTDAAEAVEDLVSALTRQGFDLPMIQRGRPQTPPPEILDVNQALAEVLNQAVLQATDQLPHQASKVIRLLLGLGTDAPLSILDTAALLSVDLQEVEMRLTYGLKQLRKLLSPEHFAAIETRLPKPKKSKELDSTSAGKTTTSSPWYVREKTKPSIEAHGTEEERFRDALVHLKDRAREVLLLRLGIGVEKPLSMKEIAERMGVKQYAIRTFQGTALRVLRNHLPTEDIKQLRRRLVFKPEDFQTGKAAKNVEPAEVVTMMEETTIENAQPTATPTTPNRILSLEEIRAAINPAPSADAVCEPAPVVQPTEPVAEQPAQVVEEAANATMDRVQQAIDALGSRRGQVMRLRLGIGLERALTIEETAERLGSTYAGIASAVYVALKELKTKLTPTEVRDIQKKLAQAKSPRRSKAAVSPAPAPQPESLAVPEPVAVVEETTDTRVEPAIESPPTTPEQATPEAVPPPNDELLQELRQSMTELQTSVKQMTAKNRELLTRVEVLEHEGEQQAEKIKEFLGELDRREVVRMNKLGATIDGLRDEMRASKAPTKLPTSPPPPPKPAEVIPIRGNNQHRAGPDGFFQAEGSSWGLTEALARRLGVNEHDLESRLASGQARSRAGLDCHGITGTFYEWSDALRLCADLVTIVPQDRYGLVKIKGQLHASQIWLAKRLHLYPKALLQRINPSVRSCLGKCRSGVFIHYRMTDVQRVCVNQSRNSTPRKAQRAK
ncbi:MAG: sigma factor-like helix-turn-helix DNA-binding protein [Patescibacteria group bacterium]